MLRLIGVVMIFGGCMEGAMLLNQSYGNRIRDMYQLVDILEYMRIEIVEERKTLPEIFVSLSKHIAKEYAQAFSEILEQKGTEEDSHLSVLYREKMRKILSEKKIGWEASEAVATVLDTDELVLGEALAGKIARGKEQLVRITREEEKEYWRKKKLVTRMGILSGGIFVLIFI